MVEIECLVCDKILKIPKYIDTNKYDGQIVCSECKALLYIKLANNNVNKYKIVKNPRAGEPVIFKVVHDKNDKEPS